MIKNIQFWAGRYLSFTNNKGDKMTFEPPSGYTEIFSFLQVEDGLICVLSQNENLTDEQWRRNVVKINKNGKIVWTVMDILDDCRKRFPGNNAILEHYKHVGFNIIYTHEDKVILGTGGPDYFLDSKTGEIEFWKAERF